MSTDEQAKATQEVAKATGQFAEIAEKVGGFVSRVIGPASTQVGGVLEDWTRYFRFRNLLAIADKVEAIQSRRKIEGKTMPIPPRIAIPMLESAALEDDETLQTVWARLIANSTDPNCNTALHPGYIDVIKQMSPDEAIILDSFRKLKSYPILFSNHVARTVEDIGSPLGGFYGVSGNRENKSYRKIHEKYIEHCGPLSLKKPSDVQVYIDNLLRLRIVELGYDFARGSGGNPYLGLGQTKDLSVSIPARDEYLRMTIFGQSFITACISENSTGDESVSVPDLHQGES